MGLIFGNLRNNDILWNSKRGVFFSVTNWTFSGDADVESTYTDTTHVDSPCITYHIVPVKNNPNKWYIQYGYIKQSTWWGETIISDVVVTPYDNFTLTKLYSEWIDVYENNIDDIKKISNSYIITYNNNNISYQDKWTHNDNDELYCISTRVM